jgi:hypothetical protein
VFIAGKVYHVGMSKAAVSLAIVLLAGQIPLAAQGVVSTVAGRSGEAGLRDGAAHQATFNRPTWLDVDARNGNLYIVDRANHALRRIEQGRVTTLPLANFSGNAPVLDFGGPYGGGIAVEPESAGCGSGQWGWGIYLANSATHQVVLVADDFGSSAAVVLTTRDGSGIVGAGTAGALDGDQSVAQFNGPGDIALSWGYLGTYDGTLLADHFYVADTGNHTIRRVSMQHYWECSHPGSVETFSGSAGQSGSLDGPRAEARFNNPRGVATAPDGSVYVADTGNHTIRRITADGQVFTVAGRAGIPGSMDGLAGESLLHNPSGIDVNELGEVFIADTGNYVIRKLTLDGRLITIAGQAGVSGYADGPARHALFSGPIGLRLFERSLYIADTASNVIRKLDLTGPEPRRRATRH